MLIEEESGGPHLDEALPLKSMVLREKRAGSDKGCNTCQTWNQ